jgi:membrane protease YdiL (CAAX protease family)
MSAFAAAMWIVGATLGFLLLGSVLAGLREQAARDQTILVVCQACAYLMTLFGILRMYGPEKGIAEFVALRGTDVGFYPLALIGGASSAVWASWLLERIHRRFPPKEEQHRLVELFFESAMPGRIAMTAAIVVIGPIVEELLFRGAIFGPMSKRHRTSTVIVVCAALFALVHVQPTVMAPIFLLGLVMGYLRAASGSLIPPLLFHVSFNGTQMVDLFLSDGPPKPGAAPEDLPRWLTLSSLAAFALSSVAAIALAKYSRTALRARESATHC